MLEIQTCPYSEVDTTLRKKLEEAAEIEFGRFSIVRETVSATPNWVFLGFQDSQLTCFYNLVLRSVRFDNQVVPVAGLNNLITLPQFRGQGIASELLRQTVHSWYHSLSAAYGLLLCSNELVPYYERLEWQQVTANVQFSQPQGKQYWQANCMLLAPDRASCEPVEIDLCGLPW